MSLIPQRKKTPEELAALRAQELASHPAHQVPQVPDQPEMDSPAKPLPSSRVEKSSQEVSELSAVDSADPLPEMRTRLRKPPPAKHGQIQAFGGLRPAAAAEVSMGSQGTHAALPHSKHDSRSLQEMRHRGMMETRPPVQRIMAMQLHPVFALMLYLMAFAVIVFTIRHWSHEGTQRFQIPAIGCGSLLLISLFLYLKKPRARHHAAILSGLCLLVLGFVILLTLKNPYAP
jgi:hypothetical protein